MTKFPQDDRDIVDFLQQYRPDVPLASLNLEQEILQQAKALPIQPVNRLSHFWLVPSVMAAGFLALFVYPTLIPNHSHVAETANVETFMESNWQTVVSENAVNYNWQAQEVTSDNNSWQPTETHIE